MNSLFFNCSSLISLPDISKLNIFNSNINNFISYIEQIINSTNEDEIRKEFEMLSFLNKTFENDLYLGNVKCEIIESKSFDKKKFKKLILSGVNNMNGLFAGCSSLQYLPDISKWNIKNTINIGCMFQGCTSLKSLS